MQSMWKFLTIICSIDGFMIVCGSSCVTVSAHLGVLRRR